MNRTLTPGHGDGCECLVCEGALADDGAPGFDSHGCRLVFAGLLCLVLIGCALTPNSLRPELEHQSHLMQHEPFTASPTHYGSNQAALVAHWDVRRAFVEIGEGVSLDRWYAGSQSYGALVGGREEFTARVGYLITVRP